MNELGRLSKTSPNPLTRILLASAHDDAPSSGARLSAATAIGIAGGLAATATAGGAAAGTATGAAAGTAATGTVAASKWIGAASLIKLAGATVVSGALVVGVVQEQRHLATPASTPSVEAVAAVTRARPAIPARPAPPTIYTAPIAPAPFEAPSPATVAAPTPLTAPPQVTRVAHPIMAQPSAPPSPVAPDEATLRDEVDQLDRAHALLTQGRAAEALTALAAYERAFPKRSLGDEADLLRIEALAKSGDVDAAKVHAERLLARDEYGPHARRVRALLASLRSGGGAP
jgi:hypothetical protein